MPKLIERTNIINFQMYNYELAIVITNDIIASRYQRNDVLKSMFGDTEQPGGLFSSATTYEGFIFLNPTADQDVIAHEAFHAVCDVLRSIGTKLNGGSEECYAYMLGYTTLHIHKFIKQVEKDFKKKKKNGKVKSK